VTVERRRLRVTGTVQGVGFRPFVYRLAVELGLAGSVANDSRGVIIDVEGPGDDLDELARRIVDETPPLARIVGLEATREQPAGGAGFHIVDSRAAGAPAVAVSVDVAMCGDCSAELVDPADRRFGYPFVNCTNCGPRYTIILSVPYDRAATTMARFPMCDDCRKEYHDPADRRFHAEPNACSVCGPQLRLLGPDGSVRAERKDALAGAVAALLGGQVVAVKGLGGYHLAVDAGRPEAVAELRRRKARDDKPFALMVADVAQAHTLVRLTPAAETELTSVRRPIVLAPRQEGPDVAPGVAPGLPELGVMLPYTPVHQLLLDGIAFGHAGGSGRSLVMTSGNLSDEPIAHDDADALARLGPMVDAILTHDRPIHIRCDDSVVRAPTPRSGPQPGSRDGRVQMVRRSRGYAPEPIALARPTARQVLAVGAELKNTVAVAKGANVIASHHIGDLEHLAAYRSFLQAVDHLCGLTGVAPDVVAHDLHPEYLSTKFAVEADVPTVAVQHHHAHIASCLVDHGREKPVLGVAFDGLGLGTDGTLWGGEFLVADLVGFRRVGHLRPVPLAGGNRAVREPWRMALAWVHAALGPDAAATYGRGADERWPAVVAMIERPDTLVTSSAGRLFDAVAALCGLRTRVTYEAQAAIELEAVCARVPIGDASGWEVEVASDDGMTIVDPSPLVTRVIAEREKGTSVSLIAAGFHDGLGRAVADVTVRLAIDNGLDTVALSGGVFQNARLTEVVVDGVAAAGLAVLTHERLPPNDGAISVGQAAIAARM